MIVKSPLFSEMSGLLDLYYFRTLKDGRILMCKRPKNGFKGSPKQLENQKRFIERFGTKGIKRK